MKVHLMENGQPSVYDLMEPVEPNIYMLLIDDIQVQIYDERGMPYWSVENGGLKHRYRYGIAPHRMKYIEFLPRWRREPKDLWKGRKRK